MVHFLLNVSLAAVPFCVSSLLSNSYELPRWLLAGLLLVLLLLSQLFTRKSIVLPILPQKFLLLVGLVIFAQICNIYLLNNLVFGDYFYYIAILFGFSFFFLQDVGGRGCSVYLNYAWSLLFSCILISVIGFLQLSGFPVLEKLVGARNEGVAATFGNVNYTAQFLGVCILFFLYAQANVSSKRSSNFFVVGIIVAITYFSFLNTRSVIIGLVLSLGWLYLRNNILTRRVLVKLIFGALILIPLSHRLVQMGAREFMTDERVKSAHIRLDMWMGTLKMIADHPLGVGIRNFNFSFVPYRQFVNLQVEDKESILNPHNEFLSIAAESGLPIAFAILACVTWFFSRFFRGKKFASENSREYDFLIAIAIFLFVESLLQFPFDGAWPVIIFSFLLAGVLNSWGFKQDKEGSILRLAFLLISAFIANHLTSYHLASAATKRSSILEKARFACDERPQDWFGCHRYAQALVKQGKSEEAEVVLLEEIKKQKYNWFAIGLLGEIYHNTGRQQAGCDLYKKIDAWFNGKSRVHDFIHDKCK